MRMCDALKAGKSRIGAASERQVSQVVSFSLMSSASVLRARENRHKILSILHVSVLKYLNDAY